MKESTERYSRGGKDALSTYKIIAKKTLEPLNPRIPACRQEGSNPFLQLNGRRTENLNT
jgi:hypothetical protein